MQGKTPEKTEKPWGYELLWAHTPNYCGKILFVKKGCRLSLHYHEIKDETMYVSEGRIAVEMADGDGEMTAFEVAGGASYRIPPGETPVRALEDTTILRGLHTGTGRYHRLTDDYGVPENPRHGLDIPAR
jgi:quercetin dioxygenase-like cupin family protein